MYSVDCRLTEHFCEDGKKHRRLSNVQSISRPGKTELNIMLATSCQPIGWVVGWIADWIPGCLAGWLEAWLAGLLDGWLATPKCFLDEWVAFSLSV